MIGDVAPFRVIDGKGRKRLQAKRPDPTPPQPQVSPEVLELAMRLDAIRARRHVTFTLMIDVVNRVYADIEREGW
jgi:hypothetical protein